VSDKLTITEALAEVKTLNARIAKKRQGVANYLLRDARLRDPMEAEGGVVDWIKRESQAIGDLEQRIVSIRTAIQRANLQTRLKVGSQTKVIAEWLNWRREVADGQKQHLNGLAGQIVNARRTVQNNKLPDGTHPDLVVHLSEKDLGAQIETMEQTLGELDGKLSLLNATTTVEA